MKAKSICICALATAILSLQLGGSAEIPMEPQGVVLGAGVFTNTTQSYAGHSYLFLGDGALALTINLPPAPGHALELLWGAKGDVRSALLNCNGKTVPLSSGGYDGFRWLRVPLPAGISGSSYQLQLTPGSPGRPAFISQVRLLALGQSPAKEGKPAVIAWKQGASTAEAFPEMRGVWDRTPVRGEGIEGELKAFVEAERNGRLAAEAFYRCRAYVDGWLAQADPKTGLIPRNLTRDRDLWNGRDSAADNYPFMVLTCALTDRPMLEGRMLDMLRTEIRLTSRLGRLSDNYSFSKQGFVNAEPKLEELMFDNAEYMKDGLVPVTEWLGPSPWSERMVGIMDDLWKYAAEETAHGKLPTLNFEVNGDLLQACARLFWFTGQRKYLDWAIRLGDYYLLGNHHPTRDLPELRMIDHGCEMINGLSELYVAVGKAAPEKQRTYREPLHAIFDRILEIGRNEHGLLYSWIRGPAGEHSKGLCDTWGYDFDGFYTLFLVDGRSDYRQAVLKALGNLRDHYPGAPWDDKSADGYADSIEGAINLLNREWVPSAAEWVDRQVRRMWSIQKPDGVIEGWHGDGNFARTSLMYALWKTQGLHLEPWRADLRLGAVAEGGRLMISLAADKPWAGRLYFDRPRSRVVMHLPLDYPRINQFPEWYTVEESRAYRCKSKTGILPARVSGKEAAAGIPIRLEPSREVRVTVQVEQ